jgi:hypothetical protein
MIFGIGMASSFAPALLDRSRPDHSQTERTLLIDMTRAGVLGTGRLDTLVQQTGGKDTDSSAAKLGASSGGKAERLVARIIPMLLNQ